MDRKPLDADASVVQLVQQLPQRVGRAVTGDLENKLILIRHGRAKQRLRGV